MLNSESGTSVSLVYTYMLNSESDTSDSLVYTYMLNSESGSLIVLYIHIC